MSILLPSLAQAKKMAKVTVCLVNIRYIAAGWQIYLHDSNGTFPLGTNNMQWFYGGKHPAIMEKYAAPYRPLNPYVDRQLKNTGSAALFRCPADRPIPIVTQGYPTYDYFGNSYMMNVMLLTKYNPIITGDTVYWKQVGGPVRLSDVKTQFSKVVVCGDCQWYYSVNDVAWDANFHNREDRVNLVFLDGHSAYTQIIRGQDPTADYSFDIYNIPPPPDPAPASAQ